MKHQHRINRRTLLAAAVAAPLAGVVGHARAAPGLADHLHASDLIYLTAIRSDGAESACQAEVWFVYDDSEVFVVTASDAWRARAVRQGLTDARIWVGNLGQWKRTAGRYRDLPHFMATGSVVGNDDTTEHALSLFGEKYRGEWLLWGPRFRGGLDDGSRVMLRYRPQPT